MHNSRCPISAYRGRDGEAAGRLLGGGLRRGLARDARPARRQGRERRRDDPRARRRARARRLHDHDRGVRRLHGAARVASPRASSEQVAAALERLEAAGRQAPRRRRRTRCSYRCAPARASRCRGCSTPSSTSASTTRPSLGLARALRRRALRLGLLPALRADVRQRRDRRPRRALRGGDRATPRRRAASRSTPSSTPRRCAI